MEEKVLDILKKHNKAITYDELIANFDEDEQSLLPEVIDKLINDYMIRLTNKGKFELLNDPSIKIGTMVANPKGFGFVVVPDEEEDYHVSYNNMNGAINGDVVVISVIDGASHEAVVRSIKERNLGDLLVGEFYTNGKRNFVKLDDDKLNIIVEIPKDGTNGAVSGHKVIIKVENVVKKSNYYKGEIVKIIGHKDDPGVDILSVAARYGIFEEFPEEVTEELKNIPDKVLDSEYEGRRDLRGEMIFTIDGDDTKDIDDAISVKRLDGGHYELGVHIADVSYYVKEGSALYEEAYNRGTSSYLANTVIPMLPHQLSNGICSLNPEVDRLAISCVMEIDEKGNTVSSDIFASVIRSRKQMTYKCVNEVIEKGIIPEGYALYADTLLLMYELAKKIRKNKNSKGYIDFGIEEPKIITDDNGVAIDIQKRNRGEGEKLIEDFMIAANEAVACTIFNMELPFIYRVHGEPDSDKLQNFMHFISVLGYKVNANLRKVTPKVVQDILIQLEKKDEYSILSSMLLRSMQKAVYDTKNIGHFGLASKCYTHFTSPIRRFPDLNVHRLLRTYLFDGNINNETINYFERTLPSIAMQSSSRERAAVDCERDVADMKMAEYMSGHIGEVFDGVVDTVTSYGMYVILPNLVEGMIKISDLEGDYYIYLEDSFSLIGKKSKKRYMLGDKVKVVVTGVNVAKGLIDFKIAGDKDGNKQQKSKV